MSPILEAEARLTAQNQISIPAVIRNALKLRGGHSRIKFQVFRGSVQVVVVPENRASKKPADDPALKPFLDLLAGDLNQHPERIKPFPPSLLNRARTLVKKVKVDLDGPLTGED